jgi:hypothetical protein
MVIVKVNRKSIQKNPYAGATTSYRWHGVKTTFKTICTEHELIELNNTKGVHIFSERRSENEMVDIDGCIDDPKYDFTKLPGSWTVDSKKDIETINHLPISEYSYKYENPLIECNVCKNKVKLSEIKLEYNYDNTYEICPICESVYSFDYKYEDIL